jgi:flagellar biosynthesis protein FlhG
MIDQAAELRHLVSQASREPHTSYGPRPRLVVFSGGKGGVGVTTLAINVAISLVDQGLRVVLVDADLYRADVATLCQLPERGHVGDILSARRDIHEVLERGPGGILVVPGVWAPDHEIPFSHHAQHRLVRQIQSLGRHADLVLVDVGSASAEAVQGFWFGADEVVLVTTPDAVSVMDCYATVKTALAGGAVPKSLRLIVNKVQAPDQAADVHRRIEQSAQRFLRRHIGALGSVAWDPAVATAVGRPAPLMLSVPDCPAAHAIEAIATALAAPPTNTQRTAA